MSNHIRNHMDALIAKGVEFQVGLRGQNQPLGPAKIERVELEDTPHSTLYRILMPAQMGPNKQQLATVTLPIVFSADDVVLIVEPPLNAGGEAAIITPGNGARTPGGLHIPGR